MIRALHFAPIARTLVATALLGFVFTVGCSDKKPIDPEVVVNPNETPEVDEGPPQAPPVDPSLIDVYLMPPGALCGNGDLDPDDNEVCDDGNNDNEDGCSANCLLVEDGFACDATGLSCQPVEVCGDNQRIGAEQCDDGNAESEDGCSETCTIEKDFLCPEEGGPCTSTVACGDSIVSGAETCDDGGTVDGDGCSAACLAEEPGWACPTAGEPCTAICGDGLVLGLEQCDDANLEPTDGCNALCRRESGFACNTPGVACSVTVCQDGTAEGDEQCDDANGAPFDGCTAECVNEPVCRSDEVSGNYTCAAVCGDGLKFPEENCDDGNTVDGDGCSADCTELEQGFDCDDARPVLGDELSFPVVFRDFPNTHPHFEIDPQNSPRLGGMVLDQLGANGKPVYNPAFRFNNRPWTLDGAKPVANGTATLANAAAISARFNEWYTDVPGVNQTLIGALTLGRNGNAFQFAQSLSNGQQFFPVDNFGFPDRVTVLEVAHNFHFTSETRTWFEYQPGDQLTFSGDDDVWVFVNGQLTVDLGGIHGELVGSILLDGPRGESSGLCLQDVFVNPPPECAPADFVPFPVAMNEGVNEIVVFQAERHVTESNYTLTMQGFDAPRTSCEPDCGDGIRTPDEACDDGEDNGSGYGFCDATCRLGPRCGDAATNGPEECDNGVNTDLYRFEADDCAPGCETPSFCGDAVTDARFQEQCDDGSDENDGSYGGCNADCTLAPRCGDGNQDDGEQCDDSNRRNNDGCSVNCQIEIIR